ncbi:Catabolic L-serine/threonine dehydratase [Candida viswanathii]|uniref:L-serine ammonia-lyase n=1 Tax=Candida viswanathii TaxID=5486 RepID=A0A367XVN6_9ASCO|nr:Catabolic L-serine/threonine dehydratase [Candida viswanathii]
MTEPSIKTSLVEATDQLPTKPPCRVFFKNELEQPSGSFKLRGMGHLVGVSIDNAKKLGKQNVEIFSSSGGNAGLAAAYASKHFGLKCTVVLPEISKPTVIEKLKSLGAEVVVHGKHWGQADNYLTDVVIKQVGESVYPVYCHPFEDPLLWEGHSKIITEILDANQLPNFDKVKGVICSVGGGGLYNGVVEGLKDYPDIPVLAVETKQAPTFHVAVKEGQVVHLKEVKTLATSLASPYISSKSLTNYTDHKTFLAEIDDLDAVRGTVDLYGAFGYMVEPACGASVAPFFHRQDLLKNFGDLQPDDIIIVVVCGGSGVNKEIIDGYRTLLE